MTKLPISLKRSVSATGLPYDDHSLQRANQDPVEIVELGAMAQGMARKGRTNFFS
jgi:hypothetical protein